MKPIKIITVAVSAMIIALTAGAQNLSFKDEARRQDVKVTVLTDDILKVEVTPFGSQAAKLPSLTLAEPLAAEASRAKKTVAGDIQTVTTATGLMVVCNTKTGSISASWNDTFLFSDPGSRDNESLSLRHGGEQSFYGGGEKGKALNLMGETLVNFNKQNYAYTLGGDKNINQMGITMPFVISSKGYGILIDDFCKSTMVVGEKTIDYSSTSPAPLTYYLINGQGRVENVVKNFTALVGRQDLPPLWSLGYITSKYGYHDQAESEGVIDTLKREGYPVDGIVFDLYWYGKEQDMGRLAWDKEQWPDHRGMLSRFKDMGVNVITISQPYVLTNGRAIDNYSELNAGGLLCKTDGTDETQEVTIWVGQGGMFDVSNPDTRLWLRNRYRALTDEGVTGWWGDLGEPEVHPETIRHHNGLSAEQYHNFYGNEWSRIIYDLFKEEYPNRRLVTLMRAGTAGLQRYSVFPWSTDVSRSWGGLAPQVNIMLNSGMSGLGYMSHDVGGFAVDPENPRDGELYIRWLQLGLFSPVLRTHSQSLAEPYNYTEYGDLPLRIIRERFRWLPYNYNLAYENASQGLPLVRPLGFYESDNRIERFDNINDEYLWGRDVLVAPVMKQGATSRQVALPEGEWIDYNNPERRFSGETTIDYSAPLEVLPLFVRAGAFIPQSVGYETMRNVGDYNPDNLVISYYPSNEASRYCLFDDDLTSTGTLEAERHRIIRFSAEPQDERCVISIVAEGAFDGAKASKNYTLEVPGVERESVVTVNDVPVKVNYDALSRVLSIPVTIADIAELTTIIIHALK